jgi:hypothetical protein
LSLICLISFHLDEWFDVLEFNGSNIRNGNSQTWLAWLVKRESLAVNLSTLLNVPGLHLLVERLKTTLSSHLILSRVIIVEETQVVFLLFWEV